VYPDSNTQNSKTQSSRTHAAKAQAAKAIPASAYRRGGRVLARAWKHFAEKYELDPLKEHPVLCLLQDLMREVEAAAVTCEKMVPVYRQHQPRWISPCVLGNLCLVCRTHAPCLAGSPCRGCRRGKLFQCERATPAPPAFRLAFRDAITLVKDGLAIFRDGNTCLQLNFSRLAHLRDASCKIDLAMLMAYAEGQPRARAAVDIGWGGPIPDVSRGEWTPEMVEASEAVVRSF
jgi:hypothetical protein